LSQETKTGLQEICFFEQAGLEDDEPSINIDDSDETLDNPEAC